MIATPYRVVELSPGRMAILPDYAASRAIAAEIEAREREAARQAARPAIVRLLAHVAPAVMHRLGGQA